MKKSFSLLLFFLLCATAFRADAQSATASGQDDSSMTSVQFDTSGFPQWAKDLRRAEIVAFGSFPFSYFFTNFAVDTYRAAANDWDRRYAPWPFTGAGAVDKTQRERFMTLGIAAGGAVLIALIDYGIVRYKRNRQQRENESYPEGTPIIIRKPASEGGEEEQSGGAGSP